MRANSFLLSVCSPVLHRMLCGSFAESKAKTLQLKDVHGAAFGKALEICCGKDHGTELSLGDVKELASVADRFQMTDVIAVLDMTVSRHLTMSVCGEVLSWSGEHGLRQSEEKAQKLARDRFEELAKSEGFTRMDEEALGRLLDDDDLLVSSEEAVWEAVVEWRRVQGQARGRGLVGKIRFPLMEEGYLRTRAAGMAPAEEAEWMEGVVGEALRAKAARGDGEGFELGLLGPKALDDRVGLGVDWERYTDGGERRLKGHTSNVFALAEVEGRVCSGSWDGSIRVWSMVGEATTCERALASGDDSGSDSVWSMTAWDGRLISGHGSGKLRVWDLATGACEQVLEGHTGSVVSGLAVIGSALASGSQDMSIKLWAMGQAGPWTCERTLLGHIGGVPSLAGWQGKVLSGSEDRTIRVWDVETGAHDATLAGHTSMVCGLAVHGDRLFSASRDGTIRVWALGTWAALRTVEACALDMGQCPRCLAVSGPHLVSGSFGHGLQQEVRVWDLQTLELQHTRPQLSGSGVWALLVAKGTVWACAGRDVVVWGRGA